MRRHPKFDLWLHDDEELAASVGSPVIDRATVHQWPLSSVERVRFASGESRIYKVQAPPTVEPEFYQQARSPLLVRAQLLTHSGSPAALLLEDVRAPRLDHVQLPPDRALRIADEVIGQIRQIAGEPPVLCDVSTTALWQSTADGIANDLRSLADAGTSEHVTTAIAEQVGGHCGSSEVARALAAPTGLVHGDLLASNVLVPEDGLRVVDWQRPLRGPRDLDRVTLLESLSIDPAPHVPAGMVTLRRLLLIGWLAEQARRWFPPGANWFGREIARVAAQLGPPARG
jgi:hypothetical protein